MHTDVMTLLAHINVQIMFILFTVAVRVSAR